ncbi:arylacetamide deacetylase [Strongylocentrotus purpuratus]|uniref:Alpha/beta hydrolase fold-3 domain-containing protein n=1 Tax=Strongylocentrotus purpuratus TaxID=7668 RepID=A0A7M7THF5_STRPU|nr:arylacetamide deacetylase [Strongylocentrotus purpuratus]
MEALGSVLFVLVATLGLLAAYLLYEPVPDGITEPTKYRSFRAISRFMKLLISISHLAHRDEPFASYYVKCLRYFFDKGAPKPPAEVEGSSIRSRVIDLGGVKARLYEPIKRSGSDLMPAFIYIHGGGMCIGSADAYDGLTRSLAEELDTVVVSIDYRLAPEHPFPIGHEDCVAATRYFMQHAENDYHVDQRRIGVGGDSAGGHLSASVANDIHDDPSLPDLKLQVLIYPSMQKIDLNTPSYQKYTADFGGSGILPLHLGISFSNLASVGKIDQEFMKNAAKNNHTSSEFKKTSLEYKYVDHNQIPAEFRDPRYYKTRNDPQTGDAALWERISHILLDARSAPLMRHDLTGVPPAYVITCGFDSLRDDGIFYKNRLEEAGVAVTWSHYEGAFHGILWLSNAVRFTLGENMRKDIVAYFKENI